jgi:phage nucleotide-binding protein
MAKTTKMYEGIKPMGSTIDRGISMIIYGDPGRGKTTLAGTLPVGETIIVNTEAGYGPLLGSGHYVFNLKEDLVQLEKFYQHLRCEDHPYKNVVIDNVSEMQDWILRVLYEGRGKDFPDVKEHGDTSTKMKEYLTLFRDLTTERNMNVIFNAWEYPMDIERTEGGVITKTYPKLYPKITIDICGKVDAVGHLEVYEKTGDRFIRFVGTTKIMAKCQFKGVEEFEEPNLPNILAKIKGYSYAKKEEKSNGVNEPVH